MTTGETAKLAPLALVPIDEPPEGDVYQFMVFPGEVAFRLEDDPAQMKVGVAVTGEGAGGGVQVSKVNLSITI